MCFLRVLFQFFGSCVWRQSLILESSWPLLLQILLLCSFSSYSNNMLNLLTLSGSSWLFCSFRVCVCVLFFFFHFHWGTLYWHLLVLAGSFLSSIQSADEPSQGTLHFLYSVWDSSIFFWFLLSVSISVFILHLFLQVLYFSIRVFSMLARVVLNSWSDDSGCRYRQRGKQALG